MHVPSFFSSAPVLSVVINSTSEMCFSGSADSTIICWSIPSLDIDPYGPYSKFWLIYNEVLHLVSYGLSRNVSFFPSASMKTLSRLLSDYYWHTVNKNDNCRTAVRNDNWHSKSIGQHKGEEIKQQYKTFRLLLVKVTIVVACV